MLLRKAELMKLLEKGEDVSSQGFDIVDDTRYNNESDGAIDDHVNEEVKQR